MCAMLTQARIEISSNATLALVYVRRRGLAALTIFPMKTGFVNEVLRKCPKQDQDGGNSKADNSGKGDQPPQRVRINEVIGLSRRSLHGWQHGQSSLIGLFSRLPRRSHDDSCLGCSCSSITSDVLTLWAIDDFSRTQSPWATDRQRHGSDMEPN